MANPTLQLKGRLLPNGWLVKELIAKGENDTGGHFSVQYEVEKEGKRFFLKAIDIYRTLQDVPLPNITTKLDEQLSIYNFEKQLLMYCRDHHTSKIALIVDSGEVRLEGELIPVPYLIFEMANGNARDFVRFSNDSDFVWKMKSLHDIAVGLMQLHKIGIFHQDVKPSNILVYNDSSSKLTDLGRSKCTALDGPFDSFTFSGDRTYAPIEILPSFSFLTTGATYNKDYAIDLYLLGNLMTYYLTGLNMSALIINNIHKYGMSSKIDEMQSFLKRAFMESVEEVRHCIYYEEFIEPLVELVTSLCNPFPDKRGDSENGKKYTLERIVSKLNLLMVRAEINFKRYGYIKR